MANRKKPAAAAEPAGRKTKQAKGKLKPSPDSSKKRKDSAEWVDVLEILDILEGK